jgi:hypothetical protein
MNLLIISFCDPPTIVFSKLRNKIDRSARESLGIKINHDIKSVKANLILLKNDDVKKINLNTTNQSLQEIPWRGNDKWYTMLAIKNNLLMISKSHDKTSIKKKNHFQFIQI